MENRKWIVEYIAELISIFQFLQPFSNFDNTIFYF